jgi:hypothetical protein
MHKRTPQSYQASSPPPRLEGEGHDSMDGGVRTASGTAVEGGSVDNQRSSEAAGIADSH